MSMKEKKENRAQFYVGVGASAGGLQALEVFFKNMSADSGAAFMVVQHLSPDYKSMMVELVSRYTSMPVYRVENNMVVEKNSIYLIPHKMNMYIRNGALFLEPQNKNHGLNLPIDIFFRSLADDKNKSALGIILSGTGSDGTLGIKAIKENGGIVMVQEPETSKFDGMPKSAIATGLVDFVLPPEKMSDSIIKYIQHPFIQKGEQLDKIIEKEGPLLNQILSIIKKKTGIDFTGYKPNTIVRRLEKRLGINQISSLSDYVDFLEKSSSEAQDLYKEFLIGVTRFFRDEEAFKALEKKIIPKIFELKKNIDPIRVWSIGCSTGEEAYSIAMLFQEYMDKHQIFCEVKIFATDIDKKSLEQGSMGLYPESIVNDVNMARLHQFFVKKNNYYQVHEKIRRMVVFARHNILRDPPFSKIDLLTCRNMLIYFQGPLQQKVMSMIHFSLKNKGFLFLGNSESVGDAAELFDSIDKKHRIYSYREAPKSFHAPLFSNLFRNRDTFPRDNILVPAQELQDGPGSWENLKNQLLESFLPPSVVLDESYNILHVFKDINDFVKIPSGRMISNLLKMLKPEISVTVGSILHKTLQGKKPFVFENVPVRGDKEYLLTLRSQWLGDLEKKQGFILLSFDKKDKKHSGKQDIAYDMGDQYKERVEELEKELQFNRENLQATIEELETSNEELQATNEELIASNEELQSTNEELQSVNEELYTVNAEFQSKIDELTQLNNDLQNLINNTNMAILFLDMKMQIRRFTPNIKSIFNIMDTDLGRPLFHISHNLQHQDLIREIQNVMDDLQFRSWEVETRDGKWFTMRMLPYRTLENAVEGVVVTFFDITEVKKNQEELLRERELLFRVLENSPLGKTVVSSEGRIIFANKRATELLGLSKSDIDGKEYDDPQWKILDIKGKPIPSENLPFSLVIGSRKSVFGYLHSIQWADGRRVFLRINGSPMFDDAGEVKGVVFSLEEITPEEAVCCRVQ